MHRLIMFEEGISVLGLVIDDDEFSGHRESPGISGVMGLMLRFHLVTISRPDVHSVSLAAMRSATMIVVTFVGTDGISGSIEASTTRNASISRTLPQASTTADGSESAPIGAVEVGCS